MSLALFEDVARAHFSNPPDTWQVLPDRDYGGWQLVDHQGVVLDHCRTQAQSERRRHSGFDAQRWYQRTDWYLGYDTAGRALTDTEQLIIVDLIEEITAAANAFRLLKGIREIRFTDQAADDQRTYQAARLPKGRYRVRGDHFHTYSANDIRFVDHQALTGFLVDLVDHTATLGAA